MTTALSVDDLSRMLLRLMDAHDPATADHLRAVSKLSLDLASFLDLSATQSRRAEVGGLLHDIGKLSIPTSLLRLPRRFTSAEYDEMRRHAHLGATMIECYPLLRDIVPIVRHHHERMDGRGYPDGLAADHIPIETRIVSVCDAFHAMTSNRAYANTRTTTAALDELARHIDTQFDRDCVEGLITLLHRRERLSIGL